MNFACKMILKYLILLICFTIKSFKYISDVSFSMFTENLEDDNERMEAQCEAEILNACELLWHLCEIVFIERKKSLEPGSFILNLLEWLYLHSPRASIWAEEAVELGRPESHLHFWDAVILYALLGCTGRAANLLSQHSAAKSTQCILSLNELLNVMPRSSMFYETSTNEFQMRWQMWQGEVRARLETGEFATIPDAQLLAEILAGHEEAFSSDRVRDLCQTWYHCMISRIFYQEPLTDIGYNLNTQCMESIRLYADVSSDGSLAATLDSLIRYVFEMNVGQFIREASESLNLWWFIAHLTDLLQHVNPSISQKCFQGSDLREYFLLEYAFGLMSHPAMWQITLSYLDYCTVFGRQHQRLFVERIHLSNERKAFMVLHACEERGLVEEARSICRCLARRELSLGRHSLALSWAVKARDCQLVTRLAKHFLTSYTGRLGFSSKPGGLDALNTLGRSALLSQKMAFLVRYREFHQLYSDGDHVGAAEILVSLFTSHTIPKIYWMPILMDAIPLLEQNHFSSVQICDFMRCLEEALVAPSSDDVSLDPKMEEIQLLQTILTKSLSRAILTEGSVEGSDVK